MTIQKIMAPSNAPCQSIELWSAKYRNSIRIIKYRIDAAIAVKKGLFLFIF